MLSEDYREDDLQEEAGWIQRDFVNHLKRCHKMIKVCARSKRWWMQEIVENRKILGSIKRARKGGVATQQQVKTQQSDLGRIIQQSKPKMWQDFCNLLQEIRSCKH